MPHLCGVLPDQCRELYYSFFFDGQECLFPIETNLLERNNQLNISERTITLMSYIRKAIRHKTIIQKNIE